MEKKDELKRARFVASPGVAKCPRFGTDCERPSPHTIAYTIRLNEYVFMLSFL